VTDAMTSGGLLAAASQAQSGVIPGSSVGRLVDGEPGTIRVLL
jgi:hypothetical protein